MERDDEVNRIARRLAALSSSQIARIERLIDTFGTPLDFELAEHSDFADEAFAAMFGEALQVHHLNSAEPFTKDKFEYTLVSTLGSLGHSARKLDRGNRGADVVIDDVPWSLKTQANSTISAEKITISKFMELGKGKWEAEADLYGLRDAMFEHMKEYERIFTLRSLMPNDSVNHVYELVEIPKNLLLLSANFPCVMNEGSTQTPKPGRCMVTDAGGNTLFHLYFDGGTERKLQIQHLAKSACVVHATWRFSTIG